MLSIQVLVPWGLDVSQEVAGILLPVCYCQLTKGISFVGSHSFCTGLCNENLQR